MAGTFTHWMVVDQAMDNCSRLPSQHAYFQTIQGLNHYVCLGAVGPDYPYLTDPLLDKYIRAHSWADRMHYERTGELVQVGIENLSNHNGQAFDLCLAWLCGFASHVITDSVIHPVVYAIVGPYIFNADDHRHCEMTQDSYIFRETKGFELRYGTSGDQGYIGLFRMCSDSSDADKINPDLKDFWTRTLQQTHPKAEPWFKDIDPDGWHKNFLSRIHSASDPIAIFRHMGEEANIVYKKTDELTPGEKTRFIDQINLPGKRTGEFKKDAFDKAVERVVDVWNRLFVDIASKNPDDCSNYILNWNLDTGVNEDKPYFW